MNRHWIDWIWHVRGSVPLAAGQSTDDAFARLDPLFHQYGTTYRRDGQALTFRKQDQPAQDKMAVFDEGELRVEPGQTGSLLRYHLISRALLFCFALPFLFLAIAQLTVVVGRYEKASTGAEKAEKAAEAKKKEAKKAEIPMNALDKALGAPAPAKKDDKKKKKEEEDEKGPSPTSAYVFAGIFAVLYLVGRWLESWLVRSLLTRKLSETPETLLEPQT